MTTRLIAGVTAMSLGIVLAVTPLAHGDTSDGKPGVGPGARIFFTQCISSLPSPEEFRQLADAGFTVVVNPTDITKPTENKNSLKAMPAYFQRAAEVGLDAGIFQGGYAVAEGGGATRVTRDARTGPYLPAHAAVGWQAIGETLVAWAKLSRVHHNFKFVGLDFEMYLGGGPDFGESYDADTFAAFFKTLTDKPAPEPLPAPEKRYEYLEKSGLIKDYMEYQRSALLREVKRVRAQIDQINPHFQIGVYGSGEFLPTVMEGFATKSAPTLDLDARTYARGLWDPAFDHEPGGGYGPQAKRPDRAGLKWSRMLVASGCREARMRSYPAVYLAGHWPQVAGPADGSQYKFTVRQSFDSAAYGDGYWIWTEPLIPKPWTSKPEWINAMMAYWKEAGAALDAGDFTWASRQADAVADPKATVPKRVVTLAGEQAAVWNPLSGQLIERKPRGSLAAPAEAEVKLDGRPLRINGTVAELIDQKNGQVIQRFCAGHGLRAVAVGDVDALPGDEVVTLNAGWVRIFDPESASELLRFRVGNDQQELTLAKD